MAHAYTKGIPLKKKFGQHFLRNQQVVDTMLDAVTLTDRTSVFEIGCGDGFLTRAILQTNVARLWVYEIDPDWAAYVRQTYPDDRLVIHQENFLDVDLTHLEPHAPWTILANLPYQVTFPILYRFAQFRHLLAEGVVMVQEEVAQKIVKTRGRGFGQPSLFFQWYFEWKLLSKIPPSSFVPPPKVFSRLVYFKPKHDLPTIPDEQSFWKFVKMCFAQPRRTLRNNLRQTHLDPATVDQKTLDLRAQQMTMEDFLALWQQVRHQW